MSDSQGFEHFQAQIRGHTCMQRYCLLLSGTYPLARLPEIQLQVLAQLLCREQLARLP